MNETSLDTIKGFQINKDGYGMIPKSVMQDQELNISTKAVYAYFCSFTGAGNSCFPTRKKICFDLNISNDSLSKYLKQLVDCGYIQIMQEKKNGRFSHNVYTLPDTKIPCPKISDTEETEHGNSDTKNNNDKSNSIYKSNSIKKKERKVSTYDSILSTLSDESLKDLYLEYIKMRKLIKSPLTDRALKMLINKVEELEPLSIDRQKMLLKNAIVGNWKSVYPLKDEPKQNQRKPQGTGDVFLDMLNECQGMNGGDIIDV